MHLLHSALVRVIWDPLAGKRPCTCWMLSLATDGPYFGTEPVGAAPLPPGQFIHYTALNFFLALVNADSGEVMYSVLSTHNV